VFIVATSVTVWGTPGTLTKEQGSPELISGYAAQRAVFKA